MSAFLRIIKEKARCHMEDHTLKLLQECSQGCKMGIKSMDQVESYVSDSRLNRVIGKYKEEHKRLENEADELLMWHGKESKQPEKMATAMSWISTEMKMMMQDDDKQVAKIMTDGCNMGVKSICGFINQYSGASKSAMKVADDLVKMEEKFRDELKAFL